MIEGCMTARVSPWLLANDWLTAEAACSLWPFRVLLLGLETSRELSKFPTLCLETPRCNFLIPWLKSVNQEDCCHLCIRGGGREKLLKDCWFFLVKCDPCSSLVVGV